MTLNHVYSEINKSMILLQSIDTNIKDNRQKARNQVNLNKAYDILDKLKDELIREHIITKQKKNKEEN